MRRSSGNQVRIGNKRDAILDQWLAIIQLDVGRQLDLAFLDAAGDVVETLRTGHGVRGALRRLGNTVGELGWPLEHLNTWILQLAMMSPRSQRAELRSPEAITATAEGWAARFATGAHSGACLDAVTGLGTPISLRVRLKEIYQHCRAFGIVPNDAYCFVVVDAETDDLAPFERDAVMITTAGVIAETFHSGETLVRHRGRLIVLASKSEATRRCTAELTDALREAPITRSVDLRVWTDELPDSTIDLDRRLRDLVGRSVG